jgi:hypothetical protein
MMRSTRAASAIERLNERTESREYSMLRTSDERFILTRRVSGQPLEKLNEAMELDDFVRFVNGQGPQKSQAREQAGCAVREEHAQQERTNAT